MNRLLPVLLVLALQQGPSAQQIRETLEGISRSLDALIQQIPSTPPILTAADLQKALDAGGTVELPGGAFTGTFTFRRSGTRLLAHGATLTGTTGPAVYIPPDVDDIEVRDIIATSGSSDSVIQCGDNGQTQTKQAQVPTGIILANVKVPTFRGRHAISIHCSGVLSMPVVADAWAADGADSQAVWIHNTCGPFAVIGGSLSAGSEIIMIHGDTLKITDCPEGVAADLTFDGQGLFRPDEWRTDGVRRSTKNLFEVKGGKRIRVRNLTGSGSWVGASGTGATQDGSAIVITPKNGLYIEDVGFEMITIERASSGVQLLGYDYNSVTPKQTSGIVFRNSSFTLSKAQNGGRGILALSTGGMGDSTWEDIRATFDGNAILQCDTPAGKPMGPFTMRGSKLTTGLYAVMANGVNYGGPTPAAYAGRECATVFGDNVFADAPKQFKGFYPLNTWVTRAELDALIAR